MTPELPVRLVLADDLRRSRLTVAFRLFLVLPHVVWGALIGTAVVLGVVANWFILLVRGTTPAGLHEFVAGYIRYVVRVEGYLLLAANPYPSFYLLGDERYPIDVEIDGPERQSRWVTAFRLILAVPAAIVSSALSGGFGGGGRGGYSAAGLAFAAAFLIWFAALARARAPRGLRDVVAWSLGYGAQVGAYVLLLTDRYPYSGPEAILPPLAEGDAEPHPVTMTVADDLRRSRLTVFFRLLLALPHVVWLTLWSVVIVLAAIVNWVVALVSGRPSRALVRFSAAYVRYSVHVGAFAFLVANPFPGFVGAPGSYPVDVEAPSGGAQSRWWTLFRLPLAAPALLVVAAASGLQSVAAVLGWFASLARGRMPEGLRNCGAYATGYWAQALAFVLLLTDRYPDSTPRRLLRV
jgi:hypothetical protein